MRFLYSERAGEPVLNLEGEDHRYLFKVRREQSGALLNLRNLKDGYDYRYKIISIDKRSATLELVDKQCLDNISKQIHLCWAVIDPKTIEKTLPFLNELGVSKITFFYAERSQKNFTINTERLQKILISSCGQCGRNDLLEIELLDSAKILLEKYRDLIVIDFSDRVFSTDTKTDIYVIGPEGGFSEKERELFGEEKIFGLKTKETLKSETAAIAVASLIGLV